MPARTPRAMRKRVINRRVKGDSFPKISLNLGVAASTAHDIIDEVIEAFPDFEEVRELNLGLKKVRISIDEAKEGADLLQRIRALEISLELLSEAVSFYEQQARSPVDLISVSQRIEALTKQFGMGPEEIIAKTEAMGKQLEPLKRSVSEAQNTLHDLQIQIPCFRSLIMLSDKLSEHEITIKAMDNFIDQNRNLLELGFTSEIASLFANELAKYGLDSKTATRILAGDIYESETLRKAIKEQRELSEDLKEEIRKNTGENNRLKTEYIIQQGKINDDKANHEIEEKTRKRNLNQLESDIGKAEEALQKLADRTTDMKSIRDTIISDLEKIEAKVETNGYLKTMTMLMAESPTPLDWKTVRKASVPFLNGFITCLQANKNEFSYSKIMDKAMTLKETLAEEARYDFRPTI